MRNNDGNTGDADDFDLLTRLIELAAQAGACRAKATAPMTRTSARRIFFAQFREISTRVDAARDEVLSRLGVTAPPQLRNRETFAMLTAKKARARCVKCRSGGGWKGRGLHWYDAHGVPAPLLAAHGGVERKVVETMLPFHDLLCIKCARKRGARIAKDGTPSINHLRKSET